MRHKSQNAGKKKREKVNLLARGRRGKNRTVKKELVREREKER